MEAERRRFYELVGQFNEEKAMAKGVLFIPVTLVNIRDKRPMQYVIDENIRDCRAFIQLLRDDWGPVERNFREDYHLALQCQADNSLPMTLTTLIRKIPLSGSPLPPEIPAPAALFETMPEFDQCMADFFETTLADCVHATDATN